MQSRKIQDGNIERFDSTARPDDSKDHSDVPCSMAEDHQQLDIIKADPDPLSHLDLDNIEGDIDFVHFLGFGKQQLLQLKDTYFHYAPNLFEGLVGAITRPDHFGGPIRNVRSEYPLYYNMQNCVPNSNQIVNNLGMSGGIDLESEKNLEGKSPWLNGDIVYAFAPSSLARRESYSNYPASVKQLGKKLMIY